MKKILLYIIIFLFFFFTCEGETLYDDDHWTLHIIDNTSGGADGVRIEDINSDGLKDIATGWEEGGVTKIYLHPGYEKVKQLWPSIQVGRTRSVEDAVFADVDRDGFFDVISCCEGDFRRMNIHWGPSSNRNYAKAALWKTDPISSSTNRMQWMFCYPLQVDKKDGVELVAAGKNNQAEIGWFQVPENPHDMDLYKWHSISSVGWVMSIFPYDMDNDQDMDIVISDRKGELRGCRWLENPGIGPGQTQQWKNHFIGGRDSEVMFMTIADYDQDGVDDVLAAAKPNKIFLFKRNDNTKIEWEESLFYFPENTGTAKAVAVGDLNHDGRKDIVFSCEKADSGKSGVMGMSFLNNKWIYFDISGKKGIKFDRIELLDLDGDGDLDILTTEERENNYGLGVIWYENPLK